MRNPRSAILVFVAALMLMWSGNLGAQELDAETGRKPTGAGQPVDAYVDESFEAHELLARLAVHEQQGRWIAASNLVKLLFESHADRLVRVDGGIYESMVTRLNRMVGGWPADGLRVYRELNDPAGRDVFEGAVGRRDVGALVAALDRYFCTSLVGSIAEAIVELALEAGDFGLARWVCLRMIEEHPDRPTEGGLESGFAARLAVIAALQGDHARADRWLERCAKVSDRPTIRWLGHDQDLALLVPSLVAEARTRRPRSESFSWPVFGGNGARNRPGEFVFERTALLWRFDEFPPSMPESWSLKGESGTEGDVVETGKGLALNPVVGEGMIFIQGSYDVIALQQSSGVPSWRYSATDDGLMHQGGSDSPIAEWYSPTLEGGRLYVCIGGEVAPYYGYDSSSYGGAVVCLDAGMGTELWRADQQRLGAEYAKMSYGSSPLVCGENVLVVARRRRTFGFEDCYLLRFRASDGELLGRTHLGSASTGGFGYRRPTLSIPAIMEGTVYVVTNLGTVVAVSAYTGRVQWLRMYQREPEESWRSATRSTLRDISPWQYNPVICTSQRLVCRPNDAQALLVLDRRTGRVEHVFDAIDLHNVQTILGVVNGRLYGVGDKVFCLDLGNGETLWTTPLPENAGVYGRGTITEKHLLIPTRSALCSFALDNGVRSEQPWDSSDAAGNLLVTPDQLLVASGRQISAYGRKADVWARLRELMAERPDDPTPALDLAEIAFRTGDRNEAKGVLDEAIRRIGGFVAVADESIRTRMFQDCMWFAREWPRDSEADLDQVKVLYEYAGQCAPDTASHVRYRFRFAEFLVEHDEPQVAVELYQQVLNDRSLSRSSIEPGKRINTAGNSARHRIEELLDRYGRHLYDPFDADAAAWLQAARSSGQVGLLDRILETRPLSTVAPDAMMLKGDLLRRAGQSRAAASAFVSALNRYRDRMDAPQLMRVIADCYAEAGQTDHAWRWLTKAAYEYPQARIQLSGGSVTLSEYRRRFDEVRPRAEARLPRLRLPLTPGYERVFDEDVTLLSPALPACPQSDWTRVYLYEQGRLHALDAGTGESLWKEPRRCRTQPEVLLATAERVVLATRHQVLGLDAKTGDRIWALGEYPIDLARPEADPEGFATFFGHVHHSGRLVAIRDDGRAGCVDVSTGQMLWQQELGYRPSGQPAMSDEWVVYRGVRAASPVYCVVEANSGRLARTIEPAGDGHVLRLHLTADGWLIAVSLRSVHAYDLQTGRLLWRSPREENVVDATVAFDLDGIYLSDDAIHLTKINLHDGSTMWQSEALFRFGMQSAHTVLQPGLLILMTDRDVFGIDTVSGRTLWQSESIAGVNFRRHLVTSSRVVAIDAPGAEQAGSYTAYFFEYRRRGGRLASVGGIVALGSFDDAGAVSVHENSVILQTGSTIIGWVSSDKSPR